MFTIDGDGFRPTRPYPFTNDRWDEELIDGMSAMLGQQPERDSSTLLVVGSGALPYLLGHLPEGPVEVHQFDLSPRVLELTPARVGLLQDHTNWFEYHEDVAEELCDPIFARVSEYRYEQELAAKSGLQADFRTTRAQAARTEILPHCGDLLELAPFIGRSLLQAGRAFDLVHLTNVADWIGTMERLFRLLTTLPLSPKALIIDSSGLKLLPIPYTLQDYAETVFDDYRR
jgi:hypothetical protein